MVVSQLCFELEQIPGHFLLSSTSMSVGKSGLGFALTQSIAEILAWWCSDLIQYLIVEVLEVVLQQAE